MIQYRVLFRYPNGDESADHVIYDSLAKLHRDWKIDNVITFVQERYVSEWSDWEES